MDNSSRAREQGQRVYFLNCFISRETFSLQKDNNSTILRKNYDKLTGFFLSDCVVAAVTKVVSLSRYKLAFLNNLNIPSTSLLTCDTQPFNTV